MSDKHPFSGFLDLSQDKFGNEPDQAAKVAVIALLSLMADVDGGLARSEFNEVIRTAVREFNLMDHEAADLRSVAKFLSEDLSKVEEFIDIVNEKFDAAQRSHILNLCWEIALADGKIDPKEKKLYGILRERLRLDIRGDE